MHIGHSNCFWFITDNTHCEEWNKGRMEDSQMISTCHTISPMPSATEHHVPCSPHLFEMCIKRYAFREACCVDIDNAINTSFSFVQTLTTALLHRKEKLLLHKTRGLSLLNSNDSQVFVFPI